jgi:hypothetical protein
MKTCIIVSTFFPPSTLAGVHRARHLAKHLPEAGWHPIIVCVDETYHEQRLDPELAKLVPDSVELIKVSALSPRITRPFGFGDVSLRGLQPLRRSVQKLLESRKIDAVLITGAPFYSMLLAPIVKKKFGVPVILDFQDPWVSAWGARQPLMSKAGLSHRIAAFLEPRILKYADFVTSVSDTQNVEMATRYPWMDINDMAGIPIGGDRDDIIALGEHSNNSLHEIIEPGYIHWSYIGTIWPGVMPTLRVFLDAVAYLCKLNPSIRERVRINFVGTSANPDDIGRNCVYQFAEVAGIGDVVREYPQRVPYLKAIELTARSDAILMMGSDEPHYTASKIYPSLMSGRPFLSVFHRASSAHKILSEAGGGIALSFENARELKEIKIKISDALLRLVQAPETIGKIDSAVILPFEARMIAKRYAQIFDRLACAYG